MPLLALTIFLSAFLLFQVEPLIARYVLPWFGGGPAVWTTCLLFFQVVLLLGYGYAHVLTRLLSPRRQGLFHMALLAVSLVFLPVGVAAAWKPTGSEHAALHILVMLGVSVGVPYFVLSATGPLLQSWCARLMPERAVYRLYGLSNAGSLLALLSYPFVFEPNLTRVAQSHTWSWAYALFALGCAATALMVWRAPRGSANSAAMAGSVPVVAPHWRDYAWWGGLSALGSVMLLATTNQMCQDVAVVPFLWVLPLSLYLLTFMICFDRPAWYSRGWWALLLVAGAAGALVSLQRGVQAVPILWQIGFFSVALLAACMVCHGELVIRRPHPRYLTHFYLAVSGGGAVGGVLVALVAPLVLNEFWEYPLGLAACCVLAAFAAPKDRRWLLYRWRPTLAIGLTTACLAVLAVFMLRDIVIDSGREGTRLAAVRNFYGVLRVYRVEHDANEYIEMHQGHIVHGDQFTDAARHGWPTMYYGRTSGVGVALTRFPRRHGPDGQLLPLRVGVIGMGAGTTAVYGQQGDVFRFYEINPRVVDLAESQFSFLRDSRARGTDTQLALGDARVMMERELDAGQSQQFDVLIADAFTGDAIPIHLLTRECGELYFKHLKPDGILALHISNHFLNLEPVAEGLAQAFGRRAEVFEDPGDAKGLGTAQSKWVLITNNPAFVSSRAARAGAKTILWTDDFSSLWQVLGKR